MSFYAKHLTVAFLCVVLSKTFHCSLPLCRSIQNISLQPFFMSKNISLQPFFMSFYQKHLTVASLYVNLSKTSHCSLPLCRFIQNISLQLFFFLLCLSKDSLIFFLIHSSILFFSFDCSSNELRVLIYSSIDPLGLFYSFTSLLYFFVHISIFCSLFCSSTDSFHILYSSSDSFILFHLYSDSSIDLSLSTDSLFFYLLLYSCYFASFI